MLSRTRLRQKPEGVSLEELRAKRREKEAALRKARREQHLVSKRLVRDIVKEEPDSKVFAEQAFTQQQVAQLLKDAQHGPERMKSLSYLRQSLQHKEVQQIFISVPGNMRILVGLFTSSTAEIQLEAARCLHELSQSDDLSVSEACTPATSYLLTYLSGHSAEFMELCLYTLGNLAVMSEGVRKKLLAQGVITVFQFCIQSPHWQVVEALGYALSQLLQAKDAPENIIPQVNNVLLLSHDVVQILMNLLVGTAASVSEEVAQGLELLVCPALRCLGNLLADDKITLGRVQIQDGRLLGAIFVFMAVFLQQQPFMVPECLWLLNNLTADDPLSCSALLHWALLPSLVQLLTVSKAVNLLVLTVLCNIAEKGPAYCQQLRNSNVLPAVITTLQVPDLEVASCSLEFLHLLFVHCSEAAGDFMNQSGLQTLKHYQDQQDLQERVKVIIGLCAG